MSTIADRIETFLRQELERQPDGVVEIQRNELSRRFDCVPSQVSYVLKRFTEERGYRVESRRGGGGCIRIYRLDLPREDLPTVIRRQIGGMISQSKAEAIIERLLEEGLIDQREAGMMQAAVSRQTLGLELPLRDLIRARVLLAMFYALLQPKTAPGGGPKDALRTV